MTMKNLMNNIFGWYFRERYRLIEKFVKFPIQVQNEVLNNMLSLNKHTVWGRKYDFSTIYTAEDFSKRVPLQDYETLKPYIKRMMLGEKDVLWSGQVKWFSKSSGTTSDKSKFIPVTTQNLKACHLRGTFDTMTLLYNSKPDSKIFAGKNLVMGGSLSSFTEFQDSKIGDVSAIMLANMPAFVKPFYAPSLEIGLMSEWEEKIELMARQSINENIVMLGGVPTWTIVLFRRILEITGKANILEVWPDFQTYIHGGVSFTPYREQFKTFLPSDKINYIEIYNASEGYFAIQNDPDKDDMLLMLDNGIYYEFLPIDQWEATRPLAIPLQDVKVGLNYALVITTNSGLWRYMPGDTVMFTSVFPFKIKVTGRTKQFVNAFGEEVIVSNTDKALSMTCPVFDAIVSEYTVAPIYFKNTGKAGHEWLIEFEKAPISIENFSLALDKNLQLVNSDYEAKRYKDMALVALNLKEIPKGTFHTWMKKRGKLGGQNKVPRLANHREYIDDILTLIRQDV